LGYTGRGERGWEGRWRRLLKAKGGGRPQLEGPQEEARVRGRRGGRVRRGRVRLGADPRMGMTPGSHLSATQGGGRRRGLRRAAGGLPETGLRAS
jgi:hypothetical protein